MIEIVDLLHIVRNKNMKVENRFWGWSSVRISHRPSFECLSGNCPHVRSDASAPGFGFFLYLVRICIPVLLKSIFYGRNSRIIK